MQPNNRTSSNASSTGRKAWTMVDIVALVGAFFAIGFFAGATTLAWMQGNIVFSIDPKTGHVYHVEKITDDGVLLQTWSEQERSQGSHQKTVKLHIFDPDNVARLQRGEDLVIFYYGGSSDLLTAVVTSDRKVARAWIMGFPDHHGPQAKLEQWINDPLNREQRQE